MQNQTNKVKIIPTSIVPRVVQTQYGQKTVCDVMLQTPVEEQTKMACWDQDFVNTLEVGKEIEVTYTVKQSGQYTNLTILSPNSKEGQSNRILEALTAIWKQVDKSEKGLQNRMDNLELKIDKLLEKKEIEE